MASKSQRSRSERTAALIKEQESKERRRKLLIVGSIVGVLAVVVAVGFWVQSQRDTSGNAAKDVPAHTTDTYGVLLGDDSAAHKVTIFEDFQCPVCADFEKAIGDQVEQGIQDGKIQVEYRMVAFLDQASTTNYSSRALNAAASVLDTTSPDTFNDYRRLLFENQPAEGSAGLTDDKLIELAGQAGADPSAITQMVKDNTFHQWVINATDQMSKDGVNGTPTVWIDGKSVGNSPQDGIDAIQKVLQ